MRSEAVAGDPIGISALGLASALGLDAVTACAAARAGLNRLKALPLLNWAESDDWGGEPVAGHAVPLVAHGFVGAAKVLALAHAGVRDLLPQGLAEAERVGTGVYLLLSDCGDEDAWHVARGEADEPSPSQVWRAQGLQLATRIGQWLGLPAAAVRLFYGQHAEFAEALRAAADALAAGRLERCIVGAVDCSFEPRRLQAAAFGERVKTATNPVGHLPGEAAGFVLLEGSRRAALSGRTLLARLTGASFQPAQAPGSAVAGEGQRLAAVVQAVMPEAVDDAGATPAWYVLDLNGEAARAQEWGAALVRLQGVCAGAGDWPAWFPALNFGECGAAAGAVGLAVSVRAFARGYAPAGSAVLPLVSTAGARGALRLDRLEA